MAGEATRAFQALLDLLRDADRTFLDGERTVTDPVDVAEGYRHLTHLLSYAFDLYLEADAERPAFVPLASPTRKILGDNVDSRYRFAPLGGDRAYRIRGVRGDAVYLAFCVYGGKPDGEWSERVVGNVSQRDLTFAPDGAFELVLAPTRPPGTIADWLQIDPDAVCVISREYFTDPRAARPARFTIEALAPAPPPPPLDDTTLARRLRAVATFVRETLAIVPLPALPPNVVGPPMPWSPYAPGWGTPDNIYALGAFALEPDEALVIEGRSPPCTYWGVQVWNRYMQSLDSRHHRVSLNGEQATLASDGSFRVVLAHRDPGMPNWIETAGHREGLVFCRWLQAESMPEPPTSRVVRLARTLRA
ncbi:MAG TPA: DUF1214 domain-containing protein [Candidatus Binatia bacterium]|nr:DUF1214 domain-containing protein [Candidatus Binatia bacterium]